MDKIFGKKKSCIIRNIIATILFLFIFSKLFGYLDYSVIEHVWMAVSNTGVMIFIWMLCYLIFNGFKMMIVVCEKTKVIWLLTGVYIIIMCIAVGCRYKAEMFVELKVYEAILMIMIVGICPMLISVLLAFRDKAGKTKEITVQVVLIMGVLFVYNLILLGSLDLINCLIVGTAHGFMLGKAVSKIMNKCNKAVEFITVVVGIVLSFSVILIAGGYNSTEIFTYEMWKYASYYYGPFIGGIYNIFVVRNIIYLFAVLLFCVVLHKLLSQGNVKSRCFYISYKTAYVYLAMKYIVVLCFSVAVGGMNNYWTEAYVLVDLMMMTVIIFSSYDEYEMWNKQEEIQSRKLMGIKDIFGKNAGDTFTLLETYEYEDIVSMKDDKTGKVELFVCLPGYAYKEKNYTMFSPLEHRHKILVMEHDDIEDEYVEESEYEEMMRNQTAEMSNEDNDGMDEEEEGIGFKLYAVEEGLCAEVYEKYKQALMNREEDEYWSLKKK